MKIVILDALTFGDSNLSSLEALGELTIHQTTSFEQTQARIKDFNTVITNKVLITKEHMKNTPSLKLICIAATGMNNVDLISAKELKIEIKNVVAYSTQSVVQHTFSMLFYLLGSSKYYDEYVKNGSYEKSPIFTNVSHPFYEIKGKRWGIIGLGAIGKEVASIALAFGVNVCYYSTSGKNIDKTYQQVELNELLKTCDIISIHAPSNKQTDNLLDYEQLLKCKEKSILLNLGRGGIINENAIAKIIDERDILFGLDVLTKEPIENSNPLLHIKNKDRLYITPHIAWTSVEAREKLIASLVENILSSK